MSYAYPAVFEKDGDGYFVFFPDLKGCHTYAETMEEAALNAKEALELYIEVFLEDKRPLPEPTDYFSMAGKASVIVADVAKIRTRTNGRAVKKTLSIPNWLNEEAEQRHINFSSVLQKALIEEMQLPNR